MTNPVETAGEERLRRWRLVLGGGEADGTGAALSTADQGMDEALAAVYEGALMRSVPRPAAAGAGLGPSAPAVVRWLGDIRAYPPGSHAGIVVLRLTDQSAAAAIKAVSDLATLTNPDSLAGAVTVLQRGLLRIRHP